MKKIIIAIIAIGVLTLGAIFAIAQKSESKDTARNGKGRHGFAGRGHHRGGMMLRGLDLTDAQKAQVKTIMETNRAKVKPLMESMRANREALRSATENGKFDEAQVQSLANEQASLSAQLLVERTRVKSQVYQILTPEQKEKAATLRTEMKDRFKDRMKNFRHRERTEDKSDDTSK